MNVSIIGAGNVATHWGHALRRAGIAVTGVWSRTASAAQTLASALDTMPTTDVTALPKADVFLLAVKDDAIRPIAEQVVAVHHGALLAHTAGSVPLSIFSGLTPDYGVLYPLQTFSKAREIALYDIPCFVEASNETTLCKLRDLAGKVSGRIAELDSEKRAQLHLAAVFANNFVNHCYAIATRILQANGLDGDLLHPLIRETADKAQSFPACEVQTGPAARYDQKVLERQAALLANTPTLQRIYRLMSESIHEFATQPSESRHDTIGPNPN